MKPMDIAFEKGLPANLDAERFILGSILLNDACYINVAAALEREDFSLEKHRRIFARMADLRERGEKIDRVTIANELMRAGQLESVDGLSYIVSLDQGLPEVSNVDSYIRIVKDKGTLRKIIFASQALALRCLNDEMPSQILADAGADFLALSDRSATTTLLTPAEIIDGEGGVVKFLDRTKPAPGAPSGLQMLDLMTGGFKPGGLYILAARPAMGKTALALNIAEHVAMRKDSEDAVLIFSLEMGKVSLVNRLICSRARVNTKRYEIGSYLNDDQERRKVQRAVSDLVDTKRILIDDKAITTIQEIHAKIIQAKARQKIGLVVVDYLQLLVGGADEHRVSEVSRISRGLKVIAKDCDIPVLALSQLSRKVEERTDKRPQLSDLRDSGSIEQDADVVEFIFREEVYKTDKPELKGMAELIIAKQRDGDIGSIPLVWFGEIVRFESRAIGAE